MTTWTADELKIFETTDELQLTSLLNDGTSSKPVTIWVVRVGDNAYVRSYRGPNGNWYRNALASHLGRILIGSVKKDVTFVEESGSEVNDQIDVAYPKKYSRYSPRYVKPMVSPTARATTLKLQPRVIGD